MKSAYLRCTAVVKTLRPGLPGTRKWQRQYGDQLVCVRYRHDDRKLYRLTTVELVVDQAPIHPKAFNQASFGIQVDRDERHLIATLRAAGARWDPALKAWWLRGDRIRQLRLVDRIHYL
jgi:hypothetical protein